MLMCIYSKIWYLMKSRLTSRWLSLRNALFNGKFTFLWFPNIGESQAFQNSRVQITKIFNIVLSKSNRKLIAVINLFHEFWLNCQWNAGFEASTNSCVIVNSTPLCSLFNKSSAAWYTSCRTLRPEAVFS